jgi:hypothetical protein
MGAVRIDTLFRTSRSSSTSIGKPNCSRSTVRIFVLPPAGALTRYTAIGA